MIRQVVWALAASSLLVGQALATTFSIPTDLPGDAGTRLQVPVLVDDSTGLQGFNLNVIYDPSMLSLEDSDVLLGQVLVAAGDWQVEANVDNIAGSAAIAMFSSAALGAGSGQVAMLDFEILDLAEGATSLDLTGPVTLGGISFDYQAGSLAIVVPEPSTGALAISALLFGVALIAHRRSRRAS